MTLLVLGDSVLAADLWTADPALSVRSGPLPANEVEVDALLDAHPDRDAMVVVASGEDALVRTALVLRRAAEDALLAGGARLVTVASPEADPTLRGGLFALVRCVTHELGDRGVASNLVLADGADRLAPVRFLASSEASFIDGACAGALELP